MSDSIEQFTNDLMRKLNAKKEYLIQKAKAEGKTEIIIGSTVQYEGYTATVIVEEIHSTADIEKFGTVEMFRLTD